MTCLFQHWGCQCPTNLEARLWFQAQSCRQQPLNTAASPGWPYRRKFIFPDNPEAARLHAPRHGALAAACRGSIKAVKRHHDHGGVCLGSRSRMTPWCRLQSRLAGFFNLICREELAQFLLNRKDLNMLLPYKRHKVFTPSLPLFRIFIPMNM